MSEAITPTLYAVLGGVAVLFFFLRGKKMRKQIAVQYAHSKAGALAQRLGFTLEKGDPETNLQFSEKGGVEHQHTDVLLAGVPYGVPCQIIYFRKAAGATKVGNVLLGESVTEVSWDCRFAVSLGVDVGRFEVRLRKPHKGLTASSYFGEEVTLPASSFGSAEIDQALLIEADDPAVGAKISNAVTPLVTMPYVHVVGEPGRVSFDMAHCIGAMYSTGGATGYGFHFIDQLLHVLSSIVCALEGKPQPGSPPPEPAQ